MIPYYQKHYFRGEKWKDLSIVSSKLRIWIKVLQRIYLTLRRAHISHWDCKFAMSELSPKQTNQHVEMLNVGEKVNSSNIKGKPMMVEMWPSSSTWGINLVTRLYWLHLLLLVQSKSETLKMQTKNSSPFLLTKKGGLVSFRLGGKKDFNTLKNPPVVWQEIQRSFGLGQKKRKIFFN